MRVTEVIAHIESLAPLQGQCGWDVSGIQVVAERVDISRLAVMLDATPERVANALEWGADFLLAHHPLAMKPQFLNASGNYLRVVRQLIRADAWCYAAHTSLDAQLHGPAGWLGQELVLEALQVLEPTLPGEPTVGIGGVGRLPAPLPWPALLERLSTLLPQTTIRHCGPMPKTINTVAYCGGSGASLMSAAFALGADVFITGDVKYHDALDSPGLLVDVGHFSLEEEMMRRMAGLLQEASQGAIDITFFPGQDPFHTLASPFSSPPSGSAPR